VDYLCLVQAAVAPPGRTPPAHRGACDSLATWNSYARCRRSCHRYGSTMPAWRGRRGDADRVPRARSAGRVHARRARAVPRRSAVTSYKFIASKRTRRRPG